MKTKTKILSVLMTVAILLSSLVLVFPTYADVVEGEGEAAPVIPTTNWSENAATAFANGGDGSKENPYIISTAAELAYLANAVEADPEFDTGKYFKLADANGDPVVIDLSAHLWDKPIGSFGKSGAGVNTRFCGHFNGNGSTIKGMIVRKTVAENGDATALFGAVAGSGVIENFSIEADIEATLAKAGQYCTISTVTGTHGAATIKNVVATANIVATQGLGTDASGKATNGQNGAIGGFSGICHNGTMEDCVMNGELTVHVGKSAAGAAFQCVVGGFASMPVSKLTYTRLTNNMNITLYKGFANCYAGGIIASIGVSGSADGAVPHTITGCVNNGNIYSYSLTENGTGNDNSRYGGIVGGTGRSIYGNSVKNPATVQQCINTGSIGGSKDGKAVSANGTSSGGFGMIVGYVEAAVTIKQCYVPYLESNLANSDAIYHFKNGVKLVTDGNGYVGKDPATRGITTDSDLMMEVGVYAADEDYAYVAVSKDSLNAFKVAGFGVELVYGTQVVTDYEDLDWDTEDDLVIAEFEYEDGVVPSLSVSKTVAGKEYTYTAIQGLSWAGISDDLAEETLTWDEEQQAYLISTPEDLATLANSVNRYIRLPSNNVKRFLLTNDIDLAGFEWMPIGSTHGLEHSYFAGIIDGNNFTISNMTLTRSNYLYAQAFIGYFHAPSSANVTTVKNVTFDNPVIKVADLTNVNVIYGAAVVAGAQYSGKIINVDVTNLNMYGYDMPGEYYLSGLVGYGLSTIEDCSVEGTMDFTFYRDSAFVGGLVARGRSATLTNCVSDVDINVEIVRPDGKKDGGTLFVGGFIGKIHGNADTDTNTIDSCVSKGDITVYTDAESTSKFSHVGVSGLVGGAAHNGDTEATGSLTIVNTLSMGKLYLSNPVGVVDDGTEGVGAFIGTDVLSDNATVTINGSVGLNAIAVANMKDRVVMDETTIAADLGLEILDGARVRIAPDALENSGLRFDALVNFDLFEALIAAGYAVNVGVAITPEANLDAVDGVWADLEEDDPAGMLTVDATSVTATTAKQDYNFTGAIKNLDANNYTKNFTATAYFEIDFNDEVIRIFADGTTTRNIKDVANAAIEDPYGDYTAEQLAILNAYAAA